MVQVAQTCPRLASLELRIAMGLELILTPSVFAMMRLVLKNGSARKKLAQPSHLLLLVVLLAAEILTTKTILRVLWRFLVFRRYASSPALSAVTVLRNGALLMI